MLDHHYEQILNALRQDQIDRVRLAMQRFRFDVTLTDDQVFELYQAADGSIDAIMLEIAKTKFK